MNKLLAILLAILLGGAVPAMAQSPTNTPTPSNTPTATSTLTNDQRGGLATIAPPPSCGLPMNPCGALPWAVPKFPTVVLPSPTLLLTTTPIPPTTTPTGYATAGTPTNTPTVTLVPNVLDAAPINTLAAGMSNMSSTLTFSTSEIEVNGTPSSVTSMANQWGGYVGDMFGFIRGIQGILSNRTGQLIVFIFGVLVFVFLVRMSLMFLPFIIGLGRMILQAIAAFKPF